MTTWRIIYTDLKAGTVLGELPAQSFSFTDALNGDGSFVVTTPLVTTTPTGRLTNDASAIQLNVAELQEGGTAIYFQRDNAVLWGGIVWGVSADVGANLLNIEGMGFLSYFRRRYIRVDTTWSATDQLNIARALIDNAQAVPEGSIGMSTSETQTAGVTRDRTFKGYERKEVAEALVQLASVDNGFDFRFDSFRDGSGDIQTEFRTTYPAQGRRTEIVFELGTNVQLLNYRSHGGSLTNTTDAIGAGDGNDLLVRTAHNPDSLLDRPLLESVLSLSSVSVEATLDEHAARAITRGSSTIKTLSVAVFPDEVPKLGSYVVGDQIKIKGSYGYISLNDFYRITSIGAAVSPDRAEVATLSMTASEVF